MTGREYQSGQSWYKKDQDNDHLLKEYNNIQSRKKVFG